VVRVPAGESLPLALELNGVAADNRARVWLVVGEVVGPLSASVLPSPDGFASLAVTVPGPVDESLSASGLALLLFVTNRDGVALVLQVGFAVGDAAVIPEPEVVSVAIAGGSLRTVDVGEALALSAVVTVSGGAVDAVVWSSSSASVSTVDASGLVTGVGVGSATVTATSTFDPTRSATVIIDVSEPEPLFYLASNGVTVMCPDADVDDSGEVGGVLYTKRNRAGITPENAATTCTSGITNMSFLINSFPNATTFNEPIGSWDTSHVTNMSYMFYLATAFNQPIDTWDTGSVTNMKAMFYSARAFKERIGSWNTSKVTDMSFMFYDASSFNQPINYSEAATAWDTSNVTTMERMFFAASAFNQALGGWNTSNVRNMGAMFEGATLFNQDLSTWDVASICEPDLFDAGANAWSEPRPNWGSCPPP